MAIPRFMFVLGACSYPVERSETLRSLPTQYMSRPRDIKSKCCELAACSLCDAPIAAAARSKAAKCPVVEQNGEGLKSMQNHLNTGTCLNRERCRSYLTAHFFRV